MKIIILTTALFLSFAGFTQETIDFSNIFKPRTKYVSNIKTETLINVEIEASDDILEHFESQGIENPQIIVDNSEMKVIYKTGYAIANEIPIEVKYKETGRPQDGMIRNGESLKGTYSKKDKIQITEMPDLSRVDLTIIEEQQLLDMMSEGFSMDLFHENKIAVGDSVKLYSPMNIPFGQFEMNFEIENTYLLERIESDNAYFTITSVCSFNSNTSEIDISAYGTGSGNCIYSIKNKRVIERKTDLEIILKGNIQDEIQMNMTQKVSSKETMRIR